MQRIVMKFYVILCYKRENLVIFRRTVSKNASAAMFYGKPSCFLWVCFTINSPIIISSLSSSSLCLLFVWERFLDTVFVHIPTVIDNFRPFSCTFFISYDVFHVFLHQSHPKPSFLSFQIL